MAEVTGISWTDHTFNPWWGCQVVSEGCKNCYAETLSRRAGYDIWGDHTSARRVTSARNWNEPRKWNKRALANGVPEMVFSLSMGDAFEQHPDLTEPRTRFLDLVEELHGLRWQILTKRPENIFKMVPDSWLRAWPQHVWIITSAENQTQAQLRIPWLIQLQQVTDIPVIGVSAEPLLGLIQFNFLEECNHEAVIRMLTVTHGKEEASELADRYHQMWATLPNVSPKFGIFNALNHLQWIITGGESGPRHRPMDLNWARLIQKQCATYGVPHYFKQVGGARPKANGKMLDGIEYCEMPLALAS